MQVHDDRGEDALVDDWHKDRCCIIASSDKHAQPVLAQTSNSIELLCTAQAV